MAVVRTYATLQNPAIVVRSNFYVRLILSLGNLISSACSGGYHIDIKYPSIACAYQKVLVAADRPNW